MTFEPIRDAVELALIAAGLYFALGAYVQRRQRAWSALLEKRRLGVLLLLVLAVIAIKLSEDLVSGESGAIDKLVLLFIHAHVPAALNGYFEAATLTGSGYVLFPLSTAIVVALLFARRRFEAMLLAISVMGGGIAVYVLKAMLVGLHLRRKMMARSASDGRVLCITYPPRRFRGVQLSRLCA